MTAQTESDETDAPITTVVYGDWSDTRAKIAEEIIEACDGTPDEIELSNGSDVWVRYTDTDDAFLTMQGGIDADDLPAGCTFESVRIRGNDTVWIKLNHRALN